MTPIRFSIGAYELVLYVILGMIATINVGAQDSGHEGNEAPVWTLQIPELSFKNATIEEAATQTLRALQAAYPREKRLKGIVISLPSEYDLRVTLTAKNIPVGIAFKYIARSVLCVVTERDGIVTLTPLTAVANKDTVVVLEPSARVKATLGLGATTNEKQLRDSIQRLSVNDSLITTADYDSTKNLLLFKGTATELTLLESALELIDRGANIRSK